MKKRYLEDLSIGETRESGTLTVELEPMLEFARRYDPQYFHTDTAAARDSVFGEVIASGIYTMALWRRLDHEISHDIAWICGIAWDDVRFPIAVRAGDRLRARAECLSKRPSSSRPERGVTVFRYQLLNQHDQIVFDCRSTNLVESRAEPVTAGSR
jgi:acyl dehydratase